MELHHVIVEKLCSCAKREGMGQITSFEDKETAQDAAVKQLAFMQNSFCGKHEFDITEVNDHFVIGMLGGCDCGSHDKH
ncbi:hypothetical protein [Sulfurimonas sp. C5]|uniref:hypothetical protein n=1 Tax=Sulfurimonas sp. C5 TaxID=3036947 RepID=UPI0024559E74|nr:hypothetical protein [Sulfurimonas sp. C5]MDH4943737.1 hypothetical protein [Sulfurimonas sp. C5]